ncbi:MAG TPA: biotin synthase [Ideonella sp.]|nr:biotin synthase [Ideonella sp.]
MPAARWRAQRLQRWLAGWKRLTQAVHKGALDQLAHTGHSAGQGQGAENTRRHPASAGAGAAAVGQSIRSIYCRAMADPAVPPTAGTAGGALPRLDAAAVRRTVQRLSQQPAPWLHEEVARRMAERLPIIKQAPRQVLDWSGQAGGGAAALRAASPQARLSEVRAAAPAAEAPSWWRRAWPAKSVPVLAPGSVPAGAADLVWSNMALHFSPEPRVPMAAWRKALAADGFLMFSTLGPGSLALLRELYRKAGWGSAHAPFVDMHDLGDMLVESGFADPVMDQEILTLTYATPQALIGELQGLGANFDPQRHAGLRTPRWQARLLAALAAQAGPDWRIPLAFEVVYGHAFRAADKGPRVEAEAAIGLDEMKLMLHRSRERS